MEGPVRKLLNIGTGLWKFLGCKKQKEKEEEEEEEKKKKKKLSSERPVREIYVSGYTTRMLTACSGKLPAKYRLVPPTPEGVYLRLR
jgi:hypothetical protein